MTDVIIEASMMPAEVEALRQTADQAGKADFVREFELKGADGSTCCIFRGNFQVRKI
jgi:hypothetical protein